MKEHRCKNDIPSSFYSNESTYNSSLRQPLPITNIQLSQSIHNYKIFHSTLDQINSEAVRQIDLSSYEEALYYLQEGDRILDYAVNSGKTINKALILTILHNKACVFQGLYNLSQYSIYLQALIFNFKCTLKVTENMQNIQKEEFFSQNREVLGDYVRTKKQYGLYHFHYSALYSKLYDHHQAIKYAREGIQILKNISKLCWNYTKQKNKVLVVEEEKNIFLQLGHLNAYLTVNDHEKYLKKTQKLLKKGFEENQKIKKISKVFQNFTLGKIMQLLPLSLQQAQSLSDIQEQCSEVQSIKKVFAIAAGFFSIGTQLRLISSKNNISEDFRSTNDFKLSEVYHLYSIMTVLNYIPFSTPFLKHILKSYNNHYDHELKISEKKKQGFQNQSDSSSIIFEKQILSHGDEIVCLPQKSQIKIDNMLESVVLSKQQNIISLTNSRQLKLKSELKKITTQKGQGKKKQNRLSHLSLKSFDILFSSENNHQKNKSSSLNSKNKNFSKKKSIKQRQIQAKKKVKNKEMPNLFQKYGLMPQKKQKHEKKKIKGKQAKHKRKSRQSNKHKYKENSDINLYYSRERLTFPQLNKQTDERSRSKNKKKKVLQRELKQK